VVDFINILLQAFTCANPKSAKKTEGLIVFLALLGSVRVKALRKMFVKLTPGDFRRLQTLSKPQTQIFPFHLFYALTLPHPHKLLHSENKESISGHQSELDSRSKGCAFESRLDGNRVKAMPGTNTGSFENNTGGSPIMAHQKKVSISLTFNRQLFLYKSVFAQHFFAYSFALQFC